MTNTSNPFSRGLEIERMIRPFSGSQSSYEAGKDCGLNGPNTTNCHFCHFATPERTKDWERGKAYGETLKARRKGHA